MKTEEWDYCPKCGVSISECGQCPDAECVIKQYKDWRESIPWENRHPQNLLPHHVREQWKADLNSLTIDGVVQISAVHDFLNKYR